MKVRITLFVLLLLALPISSFSQSTLNFPRLYPAADFGQTGIAIVNPSSTAATATFTMYSATGAALGSSALTVPAGGQNAKLVSELTTTTTPGWVQVTSPTTGLQGFWLGGDFSNRNFLDGAEAAPVAQEFIFPLAIGTTELNVANLSTSNNTITIRIYGTGGTELATAVTPAALPPRGNYSNTLSAMFPAATVSNAMYVKVTGTGNITGTSKIENFIHIPSWSVINPIATSTTVTEANFPHVPTGGDWTSVLGITNFSSTAQTITITYNRSSGSPATTTKPLAANGSLRDTVQNIFGFTGSEDGWVKVTGAGPLGGFIAYGYGGLQSNGAPTNGVAVVPIQTTPQTQLIFSHVANDGVSWGSGMALLNATGTDAAIEVYIMRNAGNLVGGALSASDPAASFILPAGTKIARLLDQFVPEARANDGFVFVKSANNVPLYAFELFFDPSNKSIANVAAAAVDPSITYTPPAPAAPAPPFAITAITPSPAVRGSAVTITGTGFNAAFASNTVVFSGGSATPTAGSATSLTVTVPSTAITGPVYVTTGGRFSSSVVLVVNATSTTTITSSVTVNPSQNTIADIYVPPPSTAFNATELGIGLTTDVQINTGGSSVEMSAGTTRRLLISGTGITPSTNVAISGSGITVSSSGVTSSGAVIVHVTAAAGTALGPRNIILTNGSLDMSIITGGLIVR